VNGARGTATAAQCCKDRSAQVRGLDRDALDRVAWMDWSRLPTERRVFSKNLPQSIRYGLRSFDHWGTAHIRKDRGRHARCRFSIQT